MINPIHSGTAAVPFPNEQNVALNLMFGITPSELFIEKEVEKEIRDSI